MYSEYPLIEDFFTVPSSKPLTRGGNSKIFAISSICEKFRDRSLVMKVPNDDEYADRAIIIEGKVMMELRHNLILDSMEWFRNDQIPFVNAYGIFSYEGQNCLVMDRIDGFTLSEAMRKRIEIDVVDLSLQIAKGLSYLHEHQIIHSDLYPENIMLSEDTEDKFYHVYLIDIGQNRVSGISPDELAEALEISDEEVDKILDLYSDFQIEIAIEIAAFAFLLREIKAEFNVPKSITKVIESSLNQNIDSRPQSMKEVIDLILSLT